MATDLDTLLKAEQLEKETLAAAVDAGAVAQAKLAKVEMTLADLTAAARRRDSVITEGDAQLASLQAAITALTKDLQPVDDLLAKMPGGLKVEVLEASIEEDLSAPPDKAVKKFSLYQKHLLDADATLAAANATVKEARNGEERARTAIDRVEAAFQASVQSAAAALTAARAALADALSARSAKDYARAFWAARQAKAFMAAAKAITLTTEKTALESAMNAYAVKVSERVEAESLALKAKTERNMEATQLAAATEQVQARLAKLIPSTG